MPVEVESEPWGDEVIETRAVQKAWLDLTRTGGPKPLQIGLYMLSVYGVKDKE